MQYLAWLIVTLLVLLMVLLMVQTTSLTYVQSPIDGDDYIVDTTYDGTDEAAIALSILNQRIVALLAYLKRRWPNDPAVRRMLAKYNPDKLAEITPVNTFGYTSYTVDEGKSMRFCLRDKQTFTLHDIEDLTFVAYHELTHVADWKANHELPFWQMFKWILVMAHEGGLYTPINYALRPMDYCGMHVAYSPFFDNNLMAYVPVP